IPDMNRIYAGQVLQIWANDLSVPISEVTQPEAPVALPTLPSDIISAPTPEQAAQPASLPVVNEIRHIVRPGEYLSQIARNYGVTWTSIAEANNIIDPNRIYAGLILRIPNARASAASTDGVISSPLPAAGEPGPRWGVGREIVVVLSTQMTYAYEDGVLQRAVRVSTGLPATPTVRGDYKIYLRRESQTMSGPGYYLPNVQWVQYFYQGYGLHGTYWHSNFGQPMSRGCVNMTNEDAEWFYRWASIGTPVHVRW
ncbi:MAG: L,D-transpeptidase family protein, partial [Anaerolineae bacterium]|nr:L,D-transpeptidase family protein [Anaerolineae bacterium]MDW8171337.1 L,D-transpeptidase family protein [Anaerolineae bacterium]